MYDYSGIRAVEFKEACPCYSRMVEYANTYSGKWGFSEGMCNKEKTMFAIIFYSLTTQGLFLTVTADYTDEPIKLTGFISSVDCQ